MLCIQDCARKNKLGGGGGGKRGQSSGGQGYKDGNLSRVLTQLSALSSKNEKLESHGFFFLK